MKPEIQEVLRLRTPELMEIPGVVGTGEGETEGMPAILVLVSRATPEVAARVPATLDGYRVLLRVTGDVRPIDDP